MDTTSINWWPYPPWGSTASEEADAPEPTPTPASLSAPEPTLTSSEPSLVSGKSAGVSSSPETQSLIEITALSPSSSSPLSIKPTGGAFAQPQTSTQFKILLPILIVLSVLLGSICAWFTYGVFMTRRRRRKTKKERKHEDELLNGTRRYEDLTVKGKPLPIVRDSSPDGRSPDLEAASRNDQEEFGWPEVDVTKPIYTRQRSESTIPHEYEEVSLVATPQVTGTLDRTKKSTRSTKTAKTYKSRDTASLLSDDEDDDEDDNKYGTLSTKLLSRIPASTRVISATGATKVDKDGSRRRTSALHGNEDTAKDDVSTKTSEPRFKIIEDEPVHLRAKSTRKGTSEGWRECLSDELATDGKSVETRQRPTADRASSYYPSEYSYVPEEEICDDQTAALISSISQSRKAQRHVSKKSYRSDRHVLSRATTQYPDFNSDDEDDRAPPAVLPSSPSQITSPLLASSLTFSASQASLVSAVEQLARMDVLPETQEEERMSADEKQHSPRKLSSPRAPPLPFPKGPGADKVYRGRLVKK